MTDQPVILRCSNPTCQRIWPGARFLPGWQIWQQDAIPCACGAPFTTEPVSLTDSDIRFLRSIKVAHEA